MHSSTVLPIVVKTHQSDQSSLDSLCVCVCVCVLLIPFTSFRPPQAIHLGYRSQKWQAFSKFGIVQQQKKSTILHILTA